jgi:hypothetical protein
MAGFLGLDELFKGRHCDREVIVPCVALNFAAAPNDPTDDMHFLGQLS